MRDQLETDGARFSVDRSGDYRAMAQAAVVVSIPGTKAIEAAVLGRPTLCIVPMNHVDEIAMNGIAGYIHLIPLVGRPLKRWIARAYERSIRFVSQPNIDAGRSIVKELRGILLPADVVAWVSAMLDHPDELRRTGAALKRIYAAHAGASGRMAEEALAIATAASSAA